MSTLEENQLEKLQKFKEWMDNDFRTYCESEYSSEVFANYIYPYYSDMLECVEYHIEDLSERVIQDQEFNYYDNNDT